MCNSTRNSYEVMSHMSCFNKDFLQEWIADSFLSFSLRNGTSMGLQNGFLLTEHPDQIKKAKSVWNILKKKISTCQQ